MVNVEPEIYLVIGNAKPALLEMEEVATLTNLVPGLQDWAAQPAEARPHDLTDTPMPGDPTLATFSQVPLPHRGHCKEERTIKRGRWLADSAAFKDGTMPYVWIGLGVAFCVALISNGFAFIGIPGMFASLIVIAFVNLRQGHRRGDDVTFRTLVEFYHAEMLAQARQRHDTLFDVNQPDVCSAEYVPRRLWASLGESRPKGENRLDEAGLLLFDDDNQRLLFEGDRYRWVVPYRSIESSDIEQLHAQLSLYAVVVKFRTVDGPKELPLVANTGVPGEDRVQRIESFAQMVYDRIRFDPAAPPARILTQAEAEFGL